MTNDPGHGDQPQPNQGWQGGPPPQQPPYPGSFGQEPQPGWGSYPPPPGPPPGPPAGFGGPGGPTGPYGPGGAEQRGFFGALFDFSFDSFATPAVVKVLYIIGLVILGLVYVGAVITGFMQGAGAACWS
ncbi:hypothetical protein BJF78_03425 [Pseudonocardia sp. CNS-139]|nr:hypothetical protein BJF78_03425 [Pseudonocardia sp. CNS-139]